MTGASCPAGAAPPRPAPPLWLGAPWTAPLLGVRGGGERGAHLRGSLSAGAVSSGRPPRRCLQAAVKGKCQPRRRRSAVKPRGEVRGSVAAGAVPPPVLSPPRPAAPPPAQACGVGARERHLLAGSGGAQK